MSRWRERAHVARSRLFKTPRRMTRSIYAPDEPVLDQIVLVLFAGVAAAES